MKQLKTQAGGQLTIFACVLEAVVIPAEAGIQQPIGKTGFPFPAYYLLGQASRE